MEAPETFKSVAEIIREEGCVGSIIEACENDEPDRRHLSCAELTHVVEHMPGCTKNPNGSCPHGADVIFLVMHHSRKCEHEECAVASCFRHIGKEYIAKTGASSAAVDKTTPISVELQKNQEEKETSGEPVTDVDTQCQILEKLAISEDNNETKEGNDNDDK